MIVEVQPALPPTFSLMSPVGHARRRPTQRISHFQVTSAFLAVVLLVNAFTPVEYELSTRCTPAPSYHVRALASRFVFLSYRKPDEPLYYKGRDDGFFITFWVFVFIFLREALMRWVLTPLASASGVKKYRYVTRFAEQGWSVVYYTASWAVGTYIMHHAPYRYLIDTSSFYQGYPHGEALDRLNKLYYLLQVAFWIQQLIVLHLEQRRNDFRQMLCHHLVTVALVTLSYVWNWTRVGNAVLCLMDFSDILLSGAKMILYTGRRDAADITFILFLISWVITRHIGYGLLMWSTAFEPVKYLEYAWRPRDGYFFSRAVHIGFNILLALLQVLLLMWAVMIFRVAYNTVVGKGASDTRSESGGSDDERDDDDEAENDTRQNGKQRVE